MSAFKSSDAPVLRSPTEDDLQTEVLGWTTIGSIAGFFIAGPFGSAAFAAVAAGAAHRIHACDKRSNELDRVLKIRK